SPQGEWVDLDIDHDHPKQQTGEAWNSGFTVKARVDRDKKIWYGEMKIPMKSIDARKPRAGLRMRVGLYRMAGIGPNRVDISWQKTGKPSFHVPESFGTLLLVK
ncbi:MAG: carbohydrate-binding family 9-like protein, partial [Bryobacteraceae bacterium]